MSADGAPERRQALVALYERARACDRCAELAASRRHVVFGAGNADADLMFVGEAPGATEDERGLPFVGRAGSLLERLLGEIGLSRSEVFIANVLKCRPPSNRDPAQVEIDNCSEYLHAQVQLIAPRLICTLGNFATKLLRADQTGITRVHGRVENVRLGEHLVRLYPLYHPAAALRSPAMLEVLREDFTQIPELLSASEQNASIIASEPLGADQLQPDPVPQGSSSKPASDLLPAGGSLLTDESKEQLDLF